jgi:hypothetical protein
MIAKPPGEPPPPPPRPVTLSPGERLLLASLRDWARRRIGDERPIGRVAATLAFRSSDRVAALFVAWIQAIERVLRRPVQITCPQCGGVSIDEQRLIVSCGLASAAFQVGEQLLEPLLIDTQSVMVLGRALNAALAAEGLDLPVRWAAASLQGGVDRPTLH